MSGVPLTSSWNPKKLSADSSRSSHRPTATAPAILACLLQTSEGAMKSTPAGCKYRRKPACHFEKNDETEAPFPLMGTLPNTPPPRPRIPWAELLARTFGFDAIKCPKCLATLSVIAYITDPVVIVKILRHLNLPTSLPAKSPARLPPQLSIDFDSDSNEPVYDRDEFYPMNASALTAASRGPPD